MSGMNNYTNPGGNNPPGSNGGNGGNGPGNPGPPVPPIPMGKTSQKGANHSDLLIDYNERFKNASPVLFRDTLVQQLMGALIGKTKPNAILTGAAGTGKTAIVEELARLIANNSPLVPPQLKNKTVYELPLGSLMAGASLVGEIEKRITEIIDFASDPKNKVILFIDEIHMLADTRDQTYTKVAQIMKPSLARGDIHVIGATTTQEAREIEKDPAFSRRFTKIIVDELDADQTFQILKILQPSYKDHYKNWVQIEDEQLRAIVETADENNRNGIHRPDNAITLMDRVMADVVMLISTAIHRAEAIKDTATAQAIRATLPQTITEKHVRGTSLRLARGLATPVEMNRQELLEDLDRIKGQDRALGQIVDIAVRNNLSPFPKTKPTVMLFAGPSGSGKTETAKILSQHLTGMDPVMLNMSEYSHAPSVTQILGSPPGYIGSDSKKEKPFDTLSANPYRLVILDEMEKAHRDVHQVFLSAFDQGFIRTADNEYVDFSKAVVVITTNSARDLTKTTQMGFRSSAATAVPTHRELMEALKRDFAPEMLSRIGHSCVFDPMTRELFMEILQDTYQRERDLAVNHHGVAHLPDRLSDEDLQQMVYDHYSEEQGARPALRAVRAWIEDRVIEHHQQQVLNMTTLAGGTSTFAPPAGDPDDDAAVDPEDQD